MVDMSWSILSNPPRLTQPLAVLVYATSNSPVSYASLHTLPMGKLKGNLTRWHDCTDLDCLDVSRLYVPARPTMAVVLRTYKNCPVLILRRKCPYAVFSRYHAYAYGLAYRANSVRSQSLRIVRYFGWVCPPLASDS
jgi:hypothetical protein